MFFCVNCHLISKLQALDNHGEKVLEPALKQVAIGNSQLSPKTGGSSAFRVGRHTSYSVLTVSSFMPNNSNLKYSSSL